MISPSEISMKLLQAAAEAPGINYSIKVQRGVDGVEVCVTFTGLEDDSHADLFAHYILSLLELNGMGSAGELPN